MPHLEKYLLEKHGPLMSGEPLYKALGFGSYSAFHRAVSIGAIGLRVFKLESRKGLFATTLDVARWVNAQAREGRPWCCVDEDQLLDRDEEGMR